MSTQEADHVVVVNCDPRNFQVQIAPLSLNILPGQTVRWSINVLGEGWIPQLSPNLGQVLPFESVTSTANTILAQRAKAGFGSVTYRVHLQFGSSVEIWEGGGALLFSERATLVELAEQLKNGDGQFVLQVSGVPEEAPLELVVVPSSCTIQDGDAVKWNFNSSCFPGGNSSSCQLQVLFTRYQPDPGTEASPNLAFGPFEMITTTNTATERSIVGSGNNEVKGHYHFQVVVIDENNSGVHWTSTEDPSIDNRDGVEG